MNRYELNRRVRDEIFSTLHIIEYGCLPNCRKDSMTSIGLSCRQHRKIRKLADNAIRIHDRKFNDIIGLLAFKAGMVALLPLLKTAAITAAASAAGGAVGSAIGGSIKDKITNPLIERIKTHVAQLANAKDENSTYTEAIIKGIKADMEKLLSIFKKEGGFIYSKINGLWQKIRGVK